jgi:hypothetical protein
MIRQEDFVDVVIILGVNTYHAHKLLIQCRAPLFWNYLLTLETNHLANNFIGFESDLTQKKVFVIPSGEMQECILCAILSWIYSAELIYDLSNYEKNSIESMMHFSERLCIPFLDIGSKNSHRDISSDLHLTLNNTLFDPDIIIEIYQLRIFCHRCVLFARSEYFRGVLKSGMYEAHIEKIQMTNEGLDQELVLLCINWIYTGRLDLAHFSLSNLFRLLIHADRFGLLELKLLCEIRLFYILNLRNVSASRLYDVLTFAQKYRTFRLQELIYTSKKFQNLAEDIVNLGVKNSQNFTSAWELEALMHIIYNEYKLSREERKSASIFQIEADFSNQQNIEQKESNESLFFDEIEDHVVSPHDFFVMEKPYFVLFTMKVLCSILYLISAILISEKIRNNLQINWMQVFLVPITALILSMIGRLAHFDHRSKFRMQWWKGRQIQKFQENLSHHMKKLDNLSKVVRKFMKTELVSYNSSINNDLDYDLGYDERDQKRARFFKNEDGKLQNSETVDNSNDSSYNSVDECDLNVSEMGNVLLKETRNLNSKLVQTRNLNTRIILHSRKEKESLLFFLFSRLSILVFFVLLGSFMTFEIEVSLNRLIISWIPLLIFNFITLSINLHTNFKIALKTWRRALQIGNLTIGKKIFIFLTLLINALFNVIFTPLGITVIQSMLLMIGVSMGYMSQSVNWFFIFFPSLFSVGFFAAGFGLLDLIFMVVGVLSLGLFTMRRQLSRMVSSFLDRNPHLSIKMILGTYLVLHTMSWSFISTVILISFKLNGSISINIELIEVNSIIFFISLFFCTLWMYFLRKFAWSSFYHVWREN